MAQPAPAAMPAPAPVPPVAAAGPTPGAASEFVCEDDVRRAINDGRKIPVDSKTIITPAARELGDTRDVFARR